MLAFSVNKGFFETSPMGVCERFLAVNVMSGVRLSRAYLPDLIHRGWGRVIFISSGSAKCP
jgi:NAD(P)-dependent dehydrogenase (short-subunit alcohol dehydrogenase family)